jgi:hypothetical protein
VSIYLSVDDMLSALGGVDAASAAKWRAAVEAQAALLAAEVAERTGLLAGKTESLEGFGGTCSEFRLARRGDSRRKLARLVKGYDPSGDWEVGVA